MTIRQLIAGRSLARLYSLLAAFALAACVAGQAGEHGLDQSGLPAIPSEPAKPSVASKPTVATDKPATISPVPRQKRPAPLSEPASKPAAKPAPRPIPDLQQLVGMNRGGLSGLLGKPTLWRSDPPAEVWQYSAAQCVLHIFLYDDAAEGRFLVSHVDVVRRQQRGIRTTGSSARSMQQECFGRVLHRVTAQNQAG